MSVNHAAAETASHPNPHTAPGDPLSERITDILLAIEAHRGAIGLAGMSVLQDGRQTPMVSMKTGDRTFALNLPELNLAALCLAMEEPFDGAARIAERLMVCGHAAQALVRDARPMFGDLIERVS